MIAANKCDVLQDESNYDRLKKEADKKGYKIYRISAVTGEGLEDLLEYISELLKEI